MNDTALRAVWPLLVVVLAGVTACHRDGTAPPAAQPQKPPAAAIDRPGSRAPRTNRPVAGPAATATAATSRRSRTSMPATSPARLRVGVRLGTSAASRRHRSSSTARCTCPATSARLRSRRRDRPERWRYDPEVDGQWGRYACCDAINRGVAGVEGPRLRRRARRLPAFDRCGDRRARLQGRHAAGARPEEAVHPLGARRSSPATA